LSVDIDQILSFGDEQVFEFVVESEDDFDFVGTAIEKVSNNSNSAIFKKQKNLYNKMENFSFEENEDFYFLKSPQRITNKEKMFRKSLSTQVNKKTINLIIKKNL
jgi:hypothetical protein